MRISFDARVRAVLVARLGLPPGVSNEQIEDAVIGKVFAVKPTPPRPTPPPAPRPAPSGPRHLAPVRSQDAEEAIAAAISEDRIMPARANHYRARCQRDPSGTADLLARLVSVPGLNARTSRAVRNLVELCEGGCRGAAKWSSCPGAAVIGSS
jgi:hypothetical protein